MNIDDFNKEELLYIISHITFRGAPASLFDKAKRKLQHILAYEEALETQFKFVTPEEYTLSTLDKAPYGSYTTYYYQANSNVRIQSKKEPYDPLKLTIRERYEFTTSEKEPSAYAIKCSRKTVELLKHRIIPNKLKMDKMGKVHVIYNTQTEVLLIDGGCLI